jgi:hypothetical protein
MRALLTRCGFSEIEDLSGSDINARWFTGREDDLAALDASHVCRATV